MVAQVGFPHPTNSLIKITVYTRAQEARHQQLMDALPNGWQPYTVGTVVPKGLTLWNGLLIPTAQFNAISASGGLNMPTATADPNIMPAHIAARLRAAEIGSFSGLRTENANTWLRAARNKLEQMQCPRRFWIPEVAIRLTEDAALWSAEWHEQTPIEERTWDQFQEAFLAKFVKQMSEFLVAREMRKLKQTGNVKDYIRAWEELRCSAPPEMIFDSPSTVLAFWDGLKSYVQRHMIMRNCVNLDSAYNEAELAAGTADSLHEHTRATRAEKTQSKAPRSSQPGRVQHANKPYDRPPSSGSAAQSNRTNFRSSATQDHDGTGNDRGTQ